MPRCRRCARTPAIAARWLPKILSRDYDPRSLPVEQKRGALVGMGMTEKQGGTDVRANTTRAEQCSIRPRPGRASATKARAHLCSWVTNGSSRRRSATPTWCWPSLTTEGSAGLSCFFVPRFLPDGSRNAIRVQRLKNKLGNRSNASSEVEFCDAIGWMIGAEGAASRPFSRWAAIPGSIA
jgi:putative acyl-CoA dehydrogenase